MQLLKRVPASALVMAGVLALAVVGPHVYQRFNPAVVPMYGGLFGVGLIGGVALALQALGVALVYRTDRIINFAQVTMGLIPAVVVLDLQRGETFLKIAQGVCPPCGGGHLADLNGTPQVVNFVLSLAIGALTGPLVGFLSHTLVMKRFREAPRLVATIVSVALAQALVVAASQLNFILFWILGISGSITGIIDVPFDWQARWAPILLHVGDLSFFVIGLVVFGGLVLFFRMSRLGTVIRAAADNTPRAETLGIRVNVLTSLTWMLAGTLSGFVAIIHGFSLPIELTAFDVNQTASMLTAVVAGAMSSLPIVAFAALVLGLAQESFSWSFQGSTIFAGCLFFLISLLYLVQPRQTHRTESESAAGWQTARQVRPVPRELRRLPVLKKYLGWGAPTLAALVLALPAALDAGQTLTASQVVVLAIIGLSLLPLTGWAGQISLGQLGLAVAGAYACVLASGSLPFPLPLLAGLLAGLLLAVLVGIPAVRLRGLHLAVATLAFAITVATFLLSPAYLGRFIEPTLQRPVFLGIDLTDERAFYYFCVACLGVVVLALMGIRRSRSARALMAARDNEPAAQSFGLSLVRVRLMAFGISGAIAGFGGSLYAYHDQALQPSLFPPSDNIQLFLSAVVGGFGAILGPVLGTSAVYLVDQLPSLAVDWLPTAGLILLLMVAPGGLTQVLFGIRDAVLRRIAVRQRLAVPSLLADRRAGSGRAAVRANRWRTGAERFTPVRYRVARQWVGREEGEASAAGIEQENVFAFILGDSSRSFADTAEETA